MSPHIVSAFRFVAANLAVFGGAPLAPIGERALFCVVGLDAMSVVALGLIAIVAMNDPSKLDADTRRDFAEDRMTPGRFFGRASIAAVIVAIIASPNLPVCLAMISIAEMVISLIFSGVIRDAVRKSGATP